MSANIYQRLIDKYLPLSDLEFYLLFQIQEPGKYGYDLATGISELSHQMVVPLPGALFGKLAEMKKDYLISETGDDEHPAYELTGGGHAVLEAQELQIQANYQLIKKDLDRLNQ